MFNFGISIIPNEGEKRMNCRKTEKGQKNCHKNYLVSISLRKK
jgi:hypothetical protein